jgi:hypothetical protein
MAFPYAFMDSLRHFGKVMPSSLSGSPSSPPQIGATVGKSCQSVGCVKGLDIVEGLGFGEMVGEDFPAERIALDVEHVLPSHPLGREVEPSNA